MDLRKSFSEKSLIEISSMASLLLFLAHVVCLLGRDEEDDDIVNDDDDEDNDEEDDDDVVLTKKFDANDCSIIRLSSSLEALETGLISSRFRVKERCVF